MTKRDARSRRIAAALWIRLEWLLSAAAAPLVVVWMRHAGVEAGAKAALIVASLLAFTLFELHRPQQWRLALVGLKLRAGKRSPQLFTELILALHRLPARLARGIAMAHGEGEEQVAARVAAKGLIALPSPRVQALFRAALAERALSPSWVKLVVSEDAEVARTRDAGGFHLVEVHPNTAAGPASLLRALFTHELAHVAHRDPLVKRVLCGLLVPGSTLAAALSAGLIEGSSAAVDPLSVTVALLAVATLLPWVYATLQATSFAMELRADQEAARVCGAAPLFELLDCLDDGGQPYRLRRAPAPRPPELVERETNRLIEELLYLLPAHPPTWERRRRLVELERGRPSRPFVRDALPKMLAASAPLAVALALGVLAVQLAGPPKLRPLRQKQRTIELMAAAPRPPSPRAPALACADAADVLCERSLEAAASALAPRQGKQALK